MGERKGTNKYYPPDFDPKKHFNLDKYHGTHALRERAKKISQGILVIRFEMPYNIWCNGCGIHIAMGVRYNAEKSKVGNYYTTPIWQFRMKCHLCDQYFEIKTDPANHDYVIVSGARRKEQRWDPKENEQIVTEDKNDVKKRATDAMFNLEHVAEDKAKIRVSAPGIHDLTEKQQQWKDDYSLNSHVRKMFRNEKKVLAVSADKDKALLQKSSLSIPLVKENPDDIRLASLIKLNPTQSFTEKQAEKRQAIESRPLFSSLSTPNKTAKQLLNASIHKQTSVFSSHQTTAKTNPLADAVKIVKKTHDKQEDKTMHVTQEKCQTKNALALVTNYDSSSSSDS